jgi:hypothetical protein
MKKELTEEQRQKRREIQKRYAERNKEKVLAASNKWNKENKEKMSEAARRHYQKQRVDSNFRDKQAEKTREWCAKNPDKVREQSARKRAYKLQRLPSWITKTELDEIACFYRTAQKLSIETGVKHHVDHIIPLRGKCVSGLHVPWNMQIITAKENMEKSNKLME